MKTVKIGILTSAFTFIAIGVVIVLHISGLVSYEVFKYLWPILLVAFGVELVWGYLTNREQRVQVSGWSLVLIVLVMLLGIGQSVRASGFIGKHIGVRYVEPVNGHVSVGNGIKRVQIEVENARVTVTGATGSEVTYDGELDVGAFSPRDAERKIHAQWSVHQVGDVLEMRLNTRPSLGFMGGFAGPHPYLNVQVPKTLSTEVVTSNGSVQVAQMNSSSTVHTSNGVVGLTDVRGDVTVGTSNGTVTLKNIAGRVDVHTTNGRIRGTSEIGGDWTCSTTNGAIELSVPSDTNATVHAQTTNGSIGGGVHWTFASRQHGRVNLGSGDHEVYLSTTNGSVKVDRRESVNR
ncbi:DUF4097 family beta strand repeat-containing protein [Alicyclobacillus shizuokensis]|uniref:DUF4097 family beta strand repeat-containing protein n=1 Tax=Alicyclobacillus shizuokensis TaxID=392014 RepID=UPI0008370273|nr:DUF4097 family beta strand repeat-containing protein [Alicyclobacillus shizuokensis]MCL6625887.1 DUF4097 family beta strand repeat-containing protein [Alicyclobacillus shizuokensis]